MDFHRQEPYVIETDPEGESGDGKVVSIVIGAKEIDGDFSAEIVATIDITEVDQKLLSEWSESDVTTFCTQYATDNGWQAILDAQIANDKANAIPDRKVFRHQQIPEG